MQYKQKKKIENQKLVFECEFPPNYEILDVAFNFQAI